MANKDSSGHGSTSMHADRERENAPKGGQSFPADKRGATDGGAHDPSHEDAANRRGGTVDERERASEAGRKSGETTYGNRRA